MADIRNCPECGKLFTFVRTNLCPECKEKVEDQFEIVKQYLLRHPRANIPEIAEATGVPDKTITGYIRDGRIVVGAVTEDSGLNCELCGTPIKTGRFCETCGKKLSDGLAPGTAGRSGQKSSGSGRETNKPEWSRSRFR